MAHTVTDAFQQSRFNWTSFELSLSYFSTPAIGRTQKKTIRSIHQGSQHSRYPTFEPRASLWSSASAVSNFASVQHCCIKHSSVRSPFICPSETITSTQWAFRMRWTVGEIKKFTAPVTFCSPSFDRQQKSICKHRRAVAGPVDYQLPTID